jgi:Cu(I)/Ag(I) efflux system membrane fusion protein
MNAPLDLPSDGEPLPEGVEAPPAGVRTMSIVRWALLALMALAAAGAWAHAARAPASADGRFHCPMHPAVVQAATGSCPVCGMDLVAIASPGSPAAPAAASAPLAGAAAAGAFWCPMHPEVASDDPEARCGKCGGMKLLPRERPPEVPGLVPVELAEERARLAGMRTARVERGRIVPRVRTVGVVTADESATALVTARFTGWIEEVRVRRAGQAVERGEILAVVYGPELVAMQQAVLNAIRWGAPQGNASLSPAPITLDARRRLQLAGVADVDIDALVRRGAPLDRLPIRAPIRGVVARRAAVPVLYVEPGAELFEIVDLSSLWVAAEVHAPDMDRLAVGQRARITFGSRPGEVVDGVVEFVYPALDAASRTLRALVALPRNDLQLRPGTYADVDLELAPAAGLVVPRDAVVDTGDRRYVFVAKAGGRIEPRLVRVGIGDGERVQVLEGVADGEAVVTTANFLVDSESRLRAAIEALPAVVAPAARETPPRG